MPRLPDALTKSIVFLINQYEEPAGTGFLLCLNKIGEPGYPFYYLVTCKHCVKDSRKARFANNQIIDLDAGGWQQALTGDDVVAVDVTDIVHKSGAGIESYDVGNEAQPGDPFYTLGVDIVMLGLFVNATNKQTNTPHARFGNLSAFADKDAPLMQGNDAKLPSHIGDMRSRTGFSGSPVWAFFDMPVLGGVELRHRLLGIHSGQFKESVVVATESTQLSMTIPSSMTIIVPATVIRDLIVENAVFVANRSRHGTSGCW